MERRTTRDKTPMIKRRYFFTLAFVISGFAINHVQAQEGCTSTKDCAEQMVSIVSKLQNENATLIKRIVALEERTPQVVCETTNARSDKHGEHSIYVEARIPNTHREYVLTGGGCGVENFDPNQWSYIVKSQKSGDGKGWKCESQHMPNFGTRRQIVATVTYCSAAWKK